MSEQYSTTPPASNEKISLHDFLKQSYSNALTRVQDGVSYIKDELSDMYNHRNYYFQQMTLPVNNFLKDFTQIESELSQEINKDSAYYLRLDGQMIPAEQILSRPMEENY